MAIRFRTSIFVAFGLLVLYFVFWREDTPFESGSHTVDVLKGVTATTEQDLVDPLLPGDVPKLSLSSSLRQGVSTSSAASKGSSRVVASSGSSTSSAALKGSSTVVASSGSSTSSAALKDTSTKGVAVGGGSTSSTASGSQSLSAHGESKTGIASPAATSDSAQGLSLQGQFDKEYDALGLKESAGAIYGKTLNHLVGAGSQAGFHSAVLIPTESWTPYSNTPPYTYNPYPDYNNEAWRADNLGEYMPCDGPEGALRDVLVFSGHPKIFEEPLMGSYVPLDIDSNLCFERQTRLGAYGYQDEESTTPMDTNTVEKSVDWSNVNWKLLQERCVETNANRYSPVPKKPQQPSNSSITLNGTENARRASTIDSQAEALEEGLHGMPEFETKAKSRTAVLLRSSSSKNYTDNDLQNMRSLVTELSLRSGGEYTVYLLVNATNSDKPIWSDALEEARRVNVPKEFQGITIVWNQAMMEKFYPKSESDDIFHPSGWFPVQRFAYDYPQYEFLWNLELDYRYTGHHYNLLEKLASFAKAQPRKGLWERNERFYIPSFHGPYDSKFRATVEQASGSETVWGAPRVEGVKPVGPMRPDMDPRDDNYQWGVGEEADYISLAPIFNPANTNWTGRNDIWGYVGPEETPRRATVGMNSRCSKKLLTTMEEENLRGNHIGSEMGPQTVALLHGLKAVFAPVPMFFDRSWNGSSLDNFFNPSPKGVSGSVLESPFSNGRDIRFEGTTWYERAVVPRRLYYNWMGWEYRGISGPEWERTHGRACLPPMLLHPIKQVVKPPPDHSS